MRSSVPGSPTSTDLDETARNARRIVDALASALR